MINSSYAYEDGPQLVDCGPENLREAAERYEKSIRPGDRVSFFWEGQHVTSVIEGPSPVWWRATLPDGRKIDLDVHNDIDEIEHIGGLTEVERLRTMVERYRNYVQEPEVIDEIEVRS